MSQRCDAARSTLILIDLQERLMPAMHDGDAVIERATLLAEAARRLEVPVLATAQYPKGLGPNVAAIAPLCDRIVEKTEFAASDAPDVRAALDPDRDQLLIAGCEAHVCVLQTALGLLQTGQDVRIVVDAIASREPRSRDIAIDRATSAGAIPVTTEMVVFEWLRNADHPQFKALSKLIK